MTERSTSEQCHSDVQGGFKGFSSTFTTHVSGQGRVVFNKAMLADRLGIFQNLHSFGHRAPKLSLRTVRILHSKNLFVLKQSNCQHFRFYLSLAKIFKEEI